MGSVCSAPITGGPSATEPRRAFLPGPLGVGSPCYAITSWRWKGDVGKREEQDHRRDEAGDLRPDDDKALSCRQRRARTGRVVTMLSVVD